MAATTVSLISVLSTGDLLMNQIHSETERLFEKQLHFSSCSTAKILFQTIVKKTWCQLNFQRVGVNQKSEFIGLLDISSTFDLFCFKIFMA